MAGKKTQGALALRLMAMGLLASCSAAPTMSEPLKPSGPRMMGLNLGAGSFAPEKVPGRHGFDYIYPDAAVVAPFVSAKFDTARLPILWERIQPEPMKPLSDSEMALVDKSIADIDGFKTIIFDIHNYAQYRGIRLDLDPQGGAKLADLWTRLAERYKDKPKIVFGIMNEPHDISARAWRGIADQTVNAIRRTGAKNLLLIPGTSWTGAHSWTEGGDQSNATAFADFKDPGEHFLFEMHQYLDGDSSGTSGNCVSPTIGSERLKAATEWLRAHKAGAVMGEFGSGSDQTCLAALDDMVGYMDKNADVWRGWTYWAGGAWWGDYPLSIQPKDDGKPRPQALVLAKYLKP